MQRDEEAMLCDAIDGVHMDFKPSEFDEFTDDFRKLVAVSKEVVDELREKP